MLALLVLGVAPLAMHHPIADVNAVGEIGTPTTLALSRTAGSAGAETSSTSERDNVLPPPVHYTVKASDTIDRIAAQAGISVDTLVQVNQLASPLLLSPGELLVVPPVDGTMISVDPTTTLDVIAQRYRVRLANLRAVNRLRVDWPLPSRVFVPSMGTDAAADPTAAPDASGAHQRVIRFGWPTKGTITQYFWEFHPGIDIANDIGTPEVAADGGKVAWAGWGDYGIYVEIDHGNGFHTVYAHMSRALVSTGQMVSKGQLIGLMGMTGRATGPHLHFEIRYQGVPQNPLDLLS
jgi:murein DD-endopeptidase MepM/ murein hydrolase activator NlpD